MEKENKVKKTKKERHGDAKKYTKGFFKGFKAFITRGNILDLAIGVVIGAAFTAIVNALVNGIILQFISLLTGNADFKDLVWAIDTGRVDADGVPIITNIQYGALIQAIVNFIIIAFVIYVIVIVLIKRQVKKNIEAEEEAKKKAEADAEAARLEEEAKAIEACQIPKDIELLTEIRNYLKDLSQKEGK